MLRFARTHVAELEGAREVALMPALTQGSGRLNEDNRAVMLAGFDRAG
jgi:hypothetical protein